MNKFEGWNVKINWVDFIEMQIAGLTTVDLGQCALSQQAKQIDPEITGATICQNKQILLFKQMKTNKHANSQNN